MKFLYFLHFFTLFAPNTLAIILKCEFKVLTYQAQSCLNDCKDSIYGCYSDGTLNITTSNEFITEISGKHLDGYNNTNVLSLRISQPIAILEISKNISNFFPNIEILEIFGHNFYSNNGLSEIRDFGQFKSLQHLTIKNVKIEVIREDVFALNPKLKTIRLKGVRQIYPNAFRGLLNINFIQVDTHFYRKAYKDNDLQEFEKFLDEISQLFIPDEYVYCRYKTKSNQLYSCSIRPYQYNEIKTRVLGNHEYNKSSNDVLHLEIISTIVVGQRKLKRIPRHLGETFPNVREMRIQNQISDLRQKDFETFPNLENLYLSYNDISMFESSTFEFTKKLRVIDLEGNYLNSIGIAAFWFLRNLKELNMKENSHIDFQADSEEDMKDLILEIKKSGIAIHDSLQCLYMNGSFKFIENDAYMCQGINMQHSPSSNTSILDRIYYAFGNHLPEMKNENVEALKIENYKLKSFPEDLPKVLPNLKSIEITKSSMKELNKESFVNFAGLIVIDLSFNSLQKIPDRIFLKNPNLVYVNFEGNNLVYIPAEIFLNNHKMDIFEFSSNNCISTSGYRDDIEEFLNEINQECK